jgi:CBS-domain-containing membrane protein
MPMDLVASHASTTVSFMVGDAMISCGMALVMATRAIRSECRKTPPGSMASQRFLTYILIFMIKAHLV